MKNWKTSLIGIVYAMLILLLTQLTTGVIDWVTILEAGAGVLFGFKAADDIKAQGAYRLLVLEWKTTLVGILMGAGAIVFTYYQAHTPVTVLVVIKAIGLSTLGILSKDSNPKP